MLSVYNMTFDVNGKQYNQYYLFVNKFTHNGVILYIAFTCQVTETCKFFKVDMKHIARMLNGVLGLCAIVHNPCQ